MRPLRILLTGGPGGGKSSALSQLRSMLIKRSFNVFAIEENATRVIEAAGGYDQRWRQPDNLVQLQRAFLFFQRAQEDVFTRLSDIKEGRTIILLDRGILDGKVFVDDELWSEIIAGENINEEGIMARYDLILHMTSVAVDRPELYEFGPGSNNPSRFHDVHEASLQDERCAQVYGAHPRVVYVRTCETFEEKIAHVLHAIEELCNNFFHSGLNLLPRQREKLRLPMISTWSSVLSGGDVKDFKQFASLVVPVPGAAAGAAGKTSIIATLQLENVEGEKRSRLDTAFTLESFLKRSSSSLQGGARTSSPTGESGIPGTDAVFYEHRYVQGERTSRKMLTAREFLLELEALQGGLSPVGRVPVGAVIKRQLCWTSESSEYFALTRYTDATDDSALDSENSWTLDKPSASAVPACLVAETEEPLLSSTPPYVGEDAVTKRPSLANVLKAHTTVDACHLAEVNAAKRRRIHE